MQSRLSVLVLIALTIGLFGSARLSSQRVDAGREVTPAQYERWKTELSNWGRWGKDDEIGALNLITPAKRRQAAGAGAGTASRCRSPPTPTRSRPSTIPIRTSTRCRGSDPDRLAVNYHGIAHTHLDSLAHINDNGVFYNGYKPDADVVVKHGHAKNSIHNVKNGIFTRGVLIDIPRLKGVPYLEPGTPIYVEDLEAWEKQAGVKVSAGRRAVRPHRRLGAAKGRGPVAARPGRRRAIGRARSVGDSVAEAARHRAAGQRSSAVRLARRTCAARSTTSRWSIWACTCSTTAISKRWPTRRPRASGGSSC